MKKIMKRFFMVAMSLIIAVEVLGAQDLKDSRRQRRDTEIYTMKELNEKASKAAKKEAKKLAKEGWVVAPGHLPLEKQLDRTYQLQYEINENGEPKYIIGDAMSIGESYDAAKFQATELVKLDIASKIQADMTELIENTRANKQLSDEQAASIIESLGASKSLVSQKIGRINPIVECYRTKQNKNKEVRLMVAYDYQKALDAAKAAIRESLEKKGEDLHEQLDTILGL